MDESKGRESGSRSSKSSQGQGSCIFSNRSAPARKNKDEEWREYIVWLMSKNNERGMARTPYEPGLKEREQ